MVDLVADYETLRAGALAGWLARDVLRISGPDAASYLQGQCSQDLETLAPGESAWSLLLEPQGKVDALVRATRTADDTFVLDVDGGFGPAVAARLQRFKLRVKADIEPLAWRCLAIRGPASTSIVASATGEVGAAGPELLVVDASWPGLPGVDMLGPNPYLPDGVEIGGSEAFEVARIEAGVPAMGAELTERTIPAEAGVVDRSVSFTKGCYTGQELVARIDSRGGHVPRHLRGVVLEGTVPVGAPLTVEEREVGVLTSVAALPRGGAVALGYIRRDVDPPVAASAAGESGPVAATIRTLPLIA